MATNLALDNSLLMLAQRVGKVKTKKETVNMALKEFIQRRKQEEIKTLFGTVEYDPAYNHKELRKRK
jgi:Arc/MetJ family transcription regulator